MRAGSGEVLRLAQAVREGERTQRPGAAGSLDRGLGAPAHHRLLRLPSSGRVSATDVHDAGRRRGGLEPIDDVPCVVEGGSSGPLERGKPSKKGTGFVQPLRPHQHWHTDISYLNLGGTFYYLCSFLDGASRAVVHWEIRESMTEADVECILERAKELYPDARPRIISDNGPQYIAKDFKTFIRISGMTHVRTAPY